MNKKIILVISAIIVVLLSVGSTYYIMKVNESKCKTCEKCDDKKEVASTFGDLYFNLVNDNLMNNEVRGAYLATEGYKIFLNKISTNDTIYKKFITKLKTIFKDTTYISNKTTYSILEKDNNNYKVYITLNPDGTYIGKENMCEGYATLNGTYEIINKEIILLKTNSERENQDLFFLHTNQNILQSITYEDCNSIKPGAFLLPE